MIYTYEDQFNPATSKDIQSPRFIALYISPSFIQPLTTMNGGAGDLPNGQTSSKQGPDSAVTINPICRRISGFAICVCLRLVRPRRT